MLLLQVVAVTLVAGTMALALAHALEFPGKMRLSRAKYIATQSIYYPGFSVGGIAEPVSVVATLILALLTPHCNPAFGWTMAAFVALAVTHLVYWMVTHPVNRFWMTGVAQGVASRFFSFSPLQRAGTPGSEQNQRERLRNTWEYSHMARAALATTGLVCLTIGVTLCGRS